MAVASDLALHDAALRHDIRGGTAADQANIQCSVLLHMPLGKAGNCKGRRRHRMDAFFRLKTRVGCLSMNCEHKGNEGRSLNGRASHRTGEIQHIGLFGTDL